MFIQRFSPSHFSLVHRRPSKFESIFKKEKGNGKNMKFKLAQINQQSPKAKNT
jgi:hypothetical protein